MAAGAAAALIASLGTSATNLALSNQQKSWSEAMQDKMNLYNSPEEQVKRLQAAGINPAALGMAGGQFISSQQSAGVNPYQLPQIQDPYAAMANSQLAQMNALKAEEEAKTVSSSRELTLEQIRDNNAVLRNQAELLGLQADEQYFINKYADLREQYALNESLSRINLSYGQLHKVLQEADNLRFELYHILPEEAKKLTSETDNNLLNLDYLTALIKRTYKESEQIEHNIEKTDAEAANLVEEREYTAEQRLHYSDYITKIIQKYDSEMKKLAADARLSDEEAYFTVFKYRSQALGSSPYTTGQRIKLDTDIENSNNYKSKEAWIDRRRY